MEKRGKRATGGIKLERCRRTIKLSDKRGGGKEDSGGGVVKNGQEFKGKDLPNGKIGRQEIKKARETSCLRYESPAELVEQRAGEMVGTQVRRGKQKETREVKTVQNQKNEKAGGGATVGREKEGMLPRD